MDNAMCKNHPDRSAVWTCSSCQGIFCEECINVQQLNMTAKMESCKICGGMCKPFGEKKMAEAASSTFSISN